MLAPGHTRAEATAGWGQGNGGAEGSVLSCPEAAYLQNPQLLEQGQRPGEPWAWGWW